MKILRPIVVLAAAAAIAAGCQSTESEPPSTSSTFAALSTTSTIETTTTAAPESATTTTQPATTTTTTTTIARSACTVLPVGTEDDFYRKACEQTGIAIVAAEPVASGALEAAADRMAVMLANRPDIAGALASSIGHVAVIGRDQRITTLPDFADLYSTHPGTDWNRLGRSFPGTEEIPVPAGAEENLLCLESDRYEGEDMFVRDVGWSMRRFGIAAVDPMLDRDIESAYNRAIAADLWRNTIAEVNSDMYWAEGVQSFFDVNNEEKDDKDQVHNQIDTRDELRAYDPSLYSLLVEVFGESTWRPECGSDG